MTEGELSKIKAYLVSAANLVRLAEGIHLVILSASAGVRRKRRPYKACDHRGCLRGCHRRNLSGWGVEAVSAFVDRQIEDFLEGWISNT